MFKNDSFDVFYDFVDRDIDGIINHYNAFLPFALKKWKMGGRLSFDEKLMVIVNLFDKDKREKLAFGDDALMQVSFDIERQFTDLDFYMEFEKTLMSMKGYEGIFPMTDDVFLNSIYRELSLDLAKRMVLLGRCDDVIYHICSISSFELDALKRSLGI